MKKLAFILILYFFVVSCEQKSQLSGNFQLSENKTWKPNVYLIQARNLNELCSNYMGTILDSAKIDNKGAFAFKRMPKITESTLLLLVVQKTNEQFLNHLENENLTDANYVPIVWKTGETIEIQAEINHFQESYTIKTPSAENDALLKLRDIRYEAYYKFLAKYNGDSHDKIIEKADATRNFRQAIIQFTEKCNYLLPSMVALRWVSPDNDYERVPEFLVSQCEKWQNKASKHPRVGELCKKANREQLPVLAGDTIPDFAMPMLSGDTTTLHQLIGAKLTMLDVWASWCAPCRLENREFLVPLWNNYHDSGFQIISYSIDVSQQNWERAIQKDEANIWLHASHLEGDDALLMKVLRIHTIPANFLLDEKGKIIAKNLHGEELSAFVKKHLTTRR